MMRRLDQGASIVPSRMHTEQWLALAGFSVCISARLRKQSPSKDCDSYYKTLLSGWKSNKISSLPGRVN